VRSSEDGDDGVRSSVFTALEVSFLGGYTFSHRGCIKRIWNGHHGAWTGRPRRTDSFVHTLVTDNGKRDRSGIKYVLIDGNGKMIDSRIDQKLSVTSWVKSTCLSASPRVAPILLKEAETR